MAIGRRGFLRLFAFTPVALAPAVFASAETGTALRGKLTKVPGDLPALQTAEGKLVPLTGDADTVGVLGDARLAQADFEVIGKQDGEKFTINPIYTAALFAYKNGKRLRVTYWCDVCSIRTYTPGLCWCCREETALDLRDPDTLDSK